MDAPTLCSAPQASASRSCDVCMGRYFCSASWMFCCDSDSVALEAQRDALRIASQQVHGLQRVQPVAILPQRVLRARSSPLPSPPARPQPTGPPSAAARSRSSPPPSASRRSPASCRTGRWSPRTRAAGDVFVVADAHRVGAAELLAQDVPQPHLQHRRGRLQRDASRTRRVRCRQRTSSPSGCAAPDPSSPSLVTTLVGNCSRMSPKLRGRASRATEATPRYVARSGVTSSTLNAPTKKNVKSAALAKRCL